MNLTLRPERKPLAKKRSRPDEYDLSDEMLDENPVSFNCVKRTPISQKMSSNSMKNKGGLKEDSKENFIEDLKSTYDQQRLFGSGSKKSSRGKHQQYFTVPLL